MMKQGVADSFVLALYWFIFLFASNTNEKRAGIA